MTNAHSITPRFQAPGGSKFTRPGQLTYAQSAAGIQPRRRVCRTLLTAKHYLNALSATWFPLQLAARIPHVRCFDLLVSVLDLS